MTLTVSSTINAPLETVWNAITNIENSVNYISGITALEVLERPESGLVGFKWKETRTMFGKEASEVMWVTEAVENSHYNVRAESHGTVYLTTMKIESVEGGTKLSWEFGGEPQTMMAKIMGKLMGGMMKSSTEKALQKDVDDIKAYIESQ